MQKFGFVTLLGETNSGKSTLVNLLVKAKVSITSHKVQTTRRRILGIYNDNINQIVFVDTPGIFKPKREFDRAMVNSAYSQTSEADIIILLIDAAKGITNSTLEIIKKLKIEKKQVLLVFNKIDLIDKPKLISLTNEIYDKDLFSKVFMISALKNKGVDDLLSYIKSVIPEEKWMFDEDELSDAPLNFLATELTREKIYKYLHKELPYMICVLPEQWQEKENSVVIKQVIMVVSNSHKKIVLGKNASTIKTISIATKKELEEVLNKKVHLYLYVKVNEKLFEDDTIYEFMGFEK